MEPFVEKNLKEIKMKVGEWGFHGDVIVKCIATKPEDFDSWPSVKDDCVAYGEVTGHAHKLFGDDFQLREEPKLKERYFVTGNIITLKHQEHEPRALLNDNDGEQVYRIGIAREYDHFEEIIREVAD